MAHRASSDRARRLQRRLRRRRQPRRQGMGRLGGGVAGAGTTGRVLLCHVGPARGVRPPSGRLLRPRTPPAPPAAGASLLTLLIRRFLAPRPRVLLRGRRQRERQGRGSSAGHEQHPLEPRAGLRVACARPGGEARGRGGGGGGREGGGGAVGDAEDRAGALRRGGCRALQAPGPASFPSSSGARVSARRVCGVLHASLLSARFVRPSGPSFLE